jgi:hypothetical protein
MNPPSPALASERRIAPPSDYADIRSATLAAAVSAADARAGVRGIIQKSAEWHVKKVNPQSMSHLTEKPVELATLAMGHSSRPGENVLDLFGGSGSTLIGAEMTGRRAFLMEIDPPYCDVIRRRWAEFVEGEGCDWQARTADAK